MKTAIVTHFLFPKEEVKRYIIENKQDMRELLSKNIITSFHVKIISDFIDKGEPVIVNEFGGYCGAKGVWEIKSIST